MAAEDNPADEITDLEYLAGLAQADREREARELAALRAERDQLAAFKRYVHARLDAAGVSADPDSPHKAEGCRIGGRLDEVFASRESLRLTLAAPMWLVWSNEHAAWWGPNRSGYFTEIDSAGRYTLEEARELCKARSPNPAGENPPELVQPAPEWYAIRESLLAVIPPLAKSEAPRA